MAGDVKVAVVSGQLSPDASGTADFTKSGFGTPKACIVLASWDETDDTSVDAESKVSIGLSDFTNDYCISHQDEDASAKVDCDAIKSNTRSYLLMTGGGAVDISGTASTITDGVRLTNDATEPFGITGRFATIIMFGGADLGVSLQSSAINSSENGTATIAHSGEVDGNDKLIFFIGTDISGEDSASSGINNSFGVCHATGSDAGGWTFVQRCIGWASDHNNTIGSPRAIISTDRVLDIIDESASQDWGLEVTALDHSPAQWTVTTRDNGAGSGMEVYSLALDLDDRKAKVGSVNSPTSGATWTPSVSLGFTPQFVGLGLTNMTIEDTIQANIASGSIGFSCNSGPGEETCHSFYNDAGAETTDTNNLFRSKAIDLRDDVATSTVVRLAHSSFNSGDWTYTIEEENLTTPLKWPFWTIEEAAGGATTIVAAQGSYALTGFASTTTKDTPVTAAQGSYALTGQAAILSQTKSILAAQGAFALTGQAAPTLWDHLLTAAQGSYALTGQAALTVKDTPITAAQGSYTLTGQAANLLWGHLVAAAQGAYTLTGQDAMTRVGQTLTAAQGAYALTGQASGLLWKHLIAAGQGSYALTGQAAVTAKTVLIAADQGSYVLTGQAANLLWAHKVLASQGSYALTGQAANLLRGYVVAANQGGYALIGQASDLLQNRLIDAAQGSYSLTGQAVVFVVAGGGSSGGGLIIAPWIKRRRIATKYI